MYQGMILLDALTLLSARRMLAALVNRDFATYYEHSLRSPRGDKWDYDLYASFRFGLDLACLEQLVQAVITSEAVLYDETNYRTLFSGDRFEFLKIPLDVFSAFEPFLQPINLSISNRLAVSSEALKSVSRYTRSKAFALFVTSLYRNGLDGAFFCLTTEYFRSGLSDPMNVCNSNDLANWPWTDSLDLHQAFAIDEELLRDCANGETPTEAEFLISNKYDRLMGTHGRQP